jgi:hypothetical protein
MGRGPGWRLPQRAHPLPSSPDLAPVQSVRRRRRGTITGLPQRRARPLVAGRRHRAEPGPADCTVVPCPAARCGRPAALPAVDLTDPVVRRTPPRPMIDVNAVSGQHLARPGQQHREHTAADPRGVRGSLVAEVAVPPHCPIPLLHAADTRPRATRSPDPTRPPRPQRQSRRPTRARGLRLSYRSQSSSPHAVHDDVPVLLRTPMTSPERHQTSCSTRDRAHRCGAVALRARVTAGDQLPAGGGDRPAGSRAPLLSTRGMSPAVSPTREAASPTQPEPSPSCADRRHMPDQLPWIWKQQLASPEACGEIDRDQSRADRVGTDRHSSLQVEVLRNATAYTGAEEVPF